MEIELSAEDLVKLAGTRRVEKDGVSILINRPVLSEVRPEGKRQLAVFYLDESDSKSLLKSER